MAMMSSVYTLPVLACALRPLRPLRPRWARGALGALGLGAACQHEHCEHARER